MPIHDQSYRRYGGGKTSPGEAWTVIAKAGIRNMIRKRAFMGVLLFAWIPFVGRAVQLYGAANFPQLSILAPDAKTFRDFLGQQDFFVFIVTIYAGAGLIAADRRANALQIYLSKPLMRIGVHRRQGRDSVHVPAVRVLGARHPPADPAGDVQGQLRVHDQQPVPVPGDHRRDVPAGARRDVHDAGALVALEEQPLRRHSLRRHPVLHRGHLRRDVRRSPAARRCPGSPSSSNITQVVDVVFRLKPHYTTPWQVSLIVLLGLIVLSISVLERRVRGVEVVT